MSDSNSAAPARPRRGVVAFLFKTWRGRVIVAIAGLVALVLALPTLASGWARGAAEEFVREHHHGSLKVGELGLAWFSEQRVKDAALMDPDGKEVARVSVLLPSLFELARSGGTKLGRVRVECSADLVADDAGLTNLARALEPRAPEKKMEEASKPSGGGAKDSKSGLDALAELELDLEVVAKHVRWSDAETRRLGKPFEVSNLVVRASAKPGASITVKADAVIAGTSAGTLAIDARVNGPITPGKEWPFGTIEARGKVTGFSGALVDGLAGQSGRLAELLGPAFDLEFRAQDVTREKGELAFDLASPAMKVALAARVEGGVVRTSGERFLDASIALPRAYLDAFVVPALPPGSPLDFGARAEPWSVRIDAFEARIPSFAELDLARLAPVLEQATARLFVSMASPIGFENAETRQAFGRACALEGTAIEVELAPKTAPRFALRSMLVASTRSPITVSAASKDLWGALASGALPHADVEVELVDVPVAALDALLGTEGKLARGLGETLRVAVKAQDAGLDRGSLDVRVNAPRFELAAPLAFADGKLGAVDGQALRARLDAPAGWIEGWLAGVLPAGVELASDDGHVAITAERFLVPLPGETDYLAELRAARGDVKVELPSVRASTAEMRAAGVSARLSRGVVDVKLGEGGRAQVVASLGLDTGSQGSVSTRVVLEDAWSVLPKDGKLAPRPFEVMLDVSAVSCALLDALAGTGERARSALGATLDAHVEAKGADLANTTVSLAIEAPRLEADFRARIEANVLRCKGAEEGLALRFTPDAGFVQRELVPFLPAGAELALAEGELRIQGREIELALPDLASGAAVDPLALLEGLRARVDVAVPDARWADERTRAANLPLGLAQLAFEVTLRPDTLNCKFAGRLEAGKSSALSGSAGLTAPWAALRNAPNPTFVFSAGLSVAGLDTTALDAFAGGPGSVSLAIGPTLDLELGSSGAWASDGFLGSAQVKARARYLDVDAPAAVEPHQVVTPQDRPIVARFWPTPEWLREELSKSLPEGARLTAPRTIDASGAVDAPIELRIANLRVLLDGDKPMSELVAGTKLDLELAVPELVYADAKTDAAGRPVVIRGLKVESKLAPDALPFARVTAVIDGEPPGELAADVRALDALKVLGEEGGLDRFRVACDVDAREVPTALVDALAGQEGLLVEAVGSRARLTVKSAGLSMAQGHVVADLASELHNVHVEGEMKDGAFRVTKQSGIDARVGLGPVMNEKVVGRLVPMLVNLRKPDGSAPSILAVDAMSFPLDGNLRGLDADVRIDLGEVTYALLPGLDQYLGNAVELKPTKLPALRVPIKQGVAGYQDLKLKIAGTECAFSGSFDLVDLTLKLDTSVPLKLLGKKVNKELDKVREYVSPDLAVPLEIRGSWKKPKVSIADGFVKKLVEDAAKKGLGDLLEGLFDKKKKKD